MRKNQMKGYVAGISFKVGLKTENRDEDIEIQEGETVKFDGIKAEIRGNEHNLKNLDSAIEAGWLIPEEEYYDQPESDYRAPSADIDVSEAQGDGQSDLSSEEVEVADEEKVVSEVDDQKELREEAEEAYTNADADQPDPNKLSSDRPSQSQSQTQSRDDSRTQQTGEGQVVAGGFESETSSNTTLDGRNASKQGINRKIKDTESAITRKDKVEGADQPARAKQSDAVSQKRDLPESGVQTMENSGDLPETSSTPAPDEGTEEAEVEDDDDLDPSTKEGRYQIAKAASDADIPEMDFDEHWRTRMKELRENPEFYQNPEAIRAVYAAESEAIKERIKDEFPDAF